MKSDILKLKILEGIPLAPFTTLKIGGAARFFCEAKNEDEIFEALKFAREKNLPVFVLGGGSNILVSDKGFGGVVIKILNTKYQIQDTKIECGAGCQLGTVVTESVKAGLTGLEWAAGIPGTIGGAVRGNAGAFGGEMKDLTQNVDVLEISNFQFPISNKNPKSKIKISSQIQNPKSKNSLCVTRYELRDCKFDYRDSIFKQSPDLIILSVTLKLKKDDRARSEKLIKEILEKRRKSQPEYPTPGSFFKNPVTKDKKLIERFEADTGVKLKDNKIPAGYLIEEAGLKGKKIGGAMVNEKHANFIVNTGKATAEDVVTLAAVVKTRVRNKFSIQLKEEVEYVGF